MNWSLKREFAIGGTTDIGFSADSQYLLIASSQGRGLISTSSFEKIARDSEWPGTWHHGKEIDGIGPCQELKITVHGFDNPTPQVLLESLTSFDFDSHITEFRAAIVSPNNQFLAVGYSSDVQLYAKL